MSLTRALARRLVHYEDQRCLGARLRRRRLVPLMAMIRRLAQTEKQIRLLDIGGMEEYWGILPESFLKEHRVEITLANLPQEDRPENHGRFRFVVADGRDLSRFDDQSFHLVHSNSVVEHVGDWGDMKRFAAEVSRVGQGYFVQTPHFWFPVEPHCMTPFFHWLPLPWRLALVRRHHLGNWPRANSLEEAMMTVSSARLLNRPMMESLFPDAQLCIERFAGLPKSMIALREPPMP